MWLVKTVYFLKITGHVFTQQWLDRSLETRCSLHEQDKDTFTKGAFQAHTLLEVYQKQMYFFLLYWLKAALIQSA